MTNGNGVSRGDRNRNARLARLRELVPRTTRSSGSIWLTRSRWSWCATTTPRCWPAGRSGAGPGTWGRRWTGPRSGPRRKGFAGVTVSCEPTGHRWRVLGQLAADRGMPFVCVQPMLTSWARRSEDLTFDKTDDKDAVLIARLTAQLRCYVPEPVDETWGRLRHLGARRERLIVEMVAQVQQIRDLLECVWPAALETAQQPFQSETWVAAMRVVLDRDGGDLDPDPPTRAGPVRDRGPPRDHQAGRAEALSADRAQLFTALTDPTGVLAHRPGALERVQLLLEDWADTQRKLADTETRMSRCSTSSSLTELVTSIPGCPRSAPPRSSPRPATRPGSPPPGPWSSTPAWRPARGCPARSPADQTHRPRPTRAALAAWRAVWGIAADQPRLRRPVPAPDHPRAQQAHSDPGPDRDRRRAPATSARRHHHRPPPGTPPSPPTAPGPSRPPRSPPEQQAAHQADGRGEPYAALRTTSTSSDIMGSPVRRPSTRLHAAGTSPIHRYAGTDDGRGTDQMLDANRLTLM